MGIVELPVDGAWAIGFVLALTRIAAFTIASPILGRAIPATGRLAFSFAVALAATRPVVGLVELGDLVTAGVANAVVGAALGYLTGIVIQLFSSAGGIVDFISGLSISTVFDPTMGEQGGVYARLFHLTAVTMFLTAGGMGLLVGGLVGSVAVLPLDATLAPQPGLAGLAITATADMVRASVELVLPVMGVLLMLELALGLAARFAPQANVFLLGLPAKLFAAITVVGSAWVVFPDAMSGVESSVARTFGTVLRGFGADVGA
jgi:flagellar biosynthetic protein FliR